MQLISVIMLALLRFPAQVSYQDTKDVTMFVDVTLHL